MGTLKHGLTISQESKLPQFHDEVTKGMGSPTITNKQRLSIFEKEPEAFEWSQQREVTLYRCHSGKLGFYFRTFQGRHETFTIVTKVKPECSSSSCINVWDRIVEINTLKIITQSKEQIYHTLTTPTELTIVLAVCQINSCSKTFETSQNSSNKRPTSQCQPHLTLTLPKASIGDTIPAGVTFSKGDDKNLTPSLCNITNKASVTIQGDNEEKKLRKEKQIREVNRNESSEINHKKNNLCNGDDKRISNESSESGRFSQGTDTEICSKLFKRGFSQVSGSSSNHSACSCHSNKSIPPMQKSNMRKKGDKGVKRFYKSVSADGPDNECEPLRSPDSLLNSPPIQSHVKMDSKYGNFMVDDHRSHSLPIKETALSVQDIVFTEDQTQSLPLPGHHATPTSPSHVSSCQCSMCKVGAELRVCHNCGTRPGSTPHKLTSPGVSVFTEVTQGQLQHDYGNFLLKNPHLAVWDGKNTHVVEIDKGNAKDFGFLNKVIISKNQDASVEIYTLVRSVDKSGPAKGLLAVGDWIRSVNSTPIQLHTDANTLIKSSNNGSKLRLLIQRPVGFSQQPQSLRATEKSPDLKPPSPQPPGFSPTTHDQDPLLASAHLPGIIEPRKGPERKILPQNIYFPDKSPSLTENSPDVGIAPFPKTVKLPKVKIFICGSEAEKCANFILRDSDITAEFPRPGYSYVCCSMASDCFGNVVISNACSNLFSTSNQFGELWCRQCGGDFTSAPSQNALGTVVNIELFVIPDDKLFHNCCSYLFTKTSIFILTFDGAKLLRSAPGEFARLQNLSHTIRSFAGDDCHIMSCGLLDCGADTRNMADEVRALFYTPFNTQLQNFSVCGPKLINVQTGIPSADSFTENQQFQHVIWKVIMDTIQKQRVLHPSLLIIDYLNSARDKDLFLTEAQLMDMIKQRLPSYQQDVHQMVLTYLNMNGEIILGKATPFNIPQLHKIESLVVIEPRALLDHLYTIISFISDDKQTWNKTHSSGFITAENFLDLCSDTPTQSQYIAEFLESFRLILRKPSLGSSVEYFLPYFALVPSSSDCPQADKKDYEIYLQFCDHESIQTFFNLMFTLVSNSDSLTSLVVQGVNCCVFQHRGVVLTVYHMKIEDRIKFILHREDKATGIGLPDLFAWLYSTCHKALDSLDVHFLLGVPCPLGATCCSKGSLGVHIVDVSDTKPNYCGEVRIDIQKPIRMWRQSSQTEAMVSPPAGISSMSLIEIELGSKMYNSICSRLYIGQRDWKELADLMGYTFESVQIFEKCETPPVQLLNHWSISHKATVEDLVKHLETLEREDILSDIRHSLSHLSVSSATKNQTSSTQMESSEPFHEFQTYRKNIQTGSDVTLMSKGDDGNQEEQGQTVKLKVVENNMVESLIGQDSKTMTPVETFHLGESPGSEA